MFTYIQAKGKQWTSVRVGEYQREVARVYHDTPERMEVVGKVEVDVVARLIAAIMRGEHLKPTAREAAVNRDKATPFA